MLRKKKICSISDIRCPETDTDGDTSLKTPRGYILVQFLYIR